MSARAAPAAGLGRVLEGWTATMPEPGSHATAVAADHLAWLGARVEPAGADAIVLSPSAGTAALAHSPISCAIEWPAGADGGDESSGEVIVQALTGLMAVHGRDLGAPRRLGLPVVSAAAGVLATQGILAALIARSRGLPTTGVRVSAMGAGLQFLSHHLTAAASGDPWAPPDGGAAPGPPFRTADGHRVELEILSPEQWHAFWSHLQVGAVELDRAWLAYAFRHNTARCTLPRALHAAVEARDLDGLREVAAACGVALCRVRTCGEVLEELRGPAGLQIPPPWRISPLPAAATAPADHGRAGTLPLAGVRVVELTSRIQGPLAGRLLGMLGAEVTRIEAPGGDPAREVPPMAGPVGAAFLAYNRNKRAVEIDYKTPAGRDAVREHAVGADVLLHNWPPGRAGSLDLEAGDLHRCNPRLVYAHASGWGGRDRGPTRLATDFLVQAHAGLGDSLNPEGEAPAPSRVTLVDVMGAMVSAEGILAALLLREAAGAGSRVDTSLLSGSLVLQGPVLTAMAGGQERRRSRGRPLWGPLDHPLETADGHVLVIASDDAEIALLAAACGVARGGRSVESFAHDLVTELRARPSQEWAARLGSVGLGCVTVPRSVEETLVTLERQSLLEQPPGGSCSPASPWHFGQP